jgi:hypothetical protein
MKVKFSWTKPSTWFAREVLDPSIREFCEDVRMDNIAIKFATKNGQEIYKRFETYRERKDNGFGSNPYMDDFAAYIELDTGSRLAVRKRWTLDDENYSGYSVVIFSPNGNKTEYYGNIEAYSIVHAFAEMFRNQEETQRRIDEEFEKNQKALADITDPFVWTKK